MTQASDRDRALAENGRNLNNKISLGVFTAAFMLECMTAIGTSSFGSQKFLATENFSTVFQN